MPDRRGRERIFEIDPVKRPQRPFWRRVVSKYVGWVQAFGYVFCAAVAAGIVVCWIYKVDEVAREKDVGKALIKPLEESVTHTKDAVVTRLAVKEWEHVADWASVVEVCDDPEWISRYKVIQQLDTFAKGLRELEKSGPLPPSAAKQAADAEKEVDAWNRGQGQKKTLVLLRAPCEGEVTGTQDLVDKFVKTGDSICKVVNFNDLRLTIKLTGTNVERVRVGMRAKVTVNPDYGLGCVVRADTKIGWFSSRRLQFNYLLDGKDVKSYLLDWWKDRHICSDEDSKRDVALTPSEIEEAEITCTVVARPLTPGEEAQARESPSLEVETIGAQNPLRATVILGKHTGSYTTNYLAPEVRQELARRVTEGLKGKVAVSPNDPKMRALRMEDISGLRTFLKIKAVIPDLTMEDTAKPSKPPGGKVTDKKAPRKDIPAAVVDEKATPETAWKLRRAEQDKEFATLAASGLDVDKGDRFFEGVVRISNPSPALSDEVKEAYHKTPAAYLKAKVEVVVGECRLAMLLFRQ